MLNNVGKTFGVVAVHVGEENGVQLSWRNVQLREPHVGSAPGVKLQLHSAAIVAVVAKADQRAGAGLTLENGGAALRAGQRDHEARRCLSRRSGGRGESERRDSCKRELA
jgi:hypothetical protein